MAVVADRVGISRETLSNIQKGDPKVSMGVYAMVVMALGMGSSWMDFADIRNDTYWQIIEDEDMRHKECGPKRIQQASERICGQRTTGGSMNYKLPKDHIGLTERCWQRLDF